MIPSRLPERYVAIDTETTGLNVWKGARMFSAAASFPGGQEYFWRDDFRGLREIVEDPTIDKVFHNAKFDWRMLERAGMQVRGRIWDTSIFCHLLDGRDAEGGLNLGALAVKYLPAAYRKVVGEIDQWFDEHGYKNTKKFQRYANFKHLPHEILRRRNVGDAVLTRMLFERTYNTVAHHFGYLLDIEHRLIPIVKRMEDRGIVVDEEEIYHQMDNFTNIVEDVLMFCRDALGWDYFNLNSGDHQRMLLEQAGIYEQITEFTKPGKKRKSLKPFKPRRKLSATNLQNLHHPVAHMMLMGKAALKMRDTFLRGALNHSVNGVLHPSYKQCGTLSGRFSCADPNLQNIPTEGERRASYTEEEAREAFEMTGISFAPHLKRIFRVREGYAHVHSDKKQAEMVVLCHYTRDQKMKDIFLSGTSIHDGICMLLFGEINKGLKQRSKAVTFGYQYGIGLLALAKKAAMSMADAKGVRGRLATTFPSLPRWQAELLAQVEERGYVQTIHGRRHYLSRRDAYMAVNRMCQGTIGDEIKSRMVHMGEFFEREGWDARIILNIHDDLATEVAQADVHRAVPRIYEMMQDTDQDYFLPLPSSLDITYTRWSDLKEVQPYDISTYPPCPAPDPLHRSVLAFAGLLPDAT